MTHVKIPGTNRSIYVELHNNSDAGEVPLDSIATRKALSADEFFAAFEPKDAGAVIRWVLTVKREGYQRHVELAQKATQLEQARLRRLSKRFGRPRTVIGFTEVEDFCLVVLYFESIGCKQAIRHTRKIWGVTCLTRRRIAETLQKIRSWKIQDIKSIANLVRVNHGLVLLPSTWPVNRKVLR
jgi:hypothetical protein